MIVVSKRIMLCPDSLNSKSKATKCCGRELDRLRAKIQNRKNSVIWDVNRFEFSKGRWLIDESEP